MLFRSNDTATTEIYTIQHTLSLHDALPICPYYQGGNGNSNSFGPNQPTLRDLIYGQAKINESLQKKLAATDKSMETIHAKMDGFSTAIKNQLSFNKMLETQLAQLAAATPAAELGKILGSPNQL